MKGYHGSNVSDTKKSASHPLSRSLVSITADRPYRDCIKPALHPTLSYSNCGSREHVPTADSACRRLSPRPFLYTFVSMKYASSLFVSLTHLLSAPSDLIPKESNFALTQNSRSKHQSPDFMAFVGIRRSVQNKPRRGILLVREEGDYSEPVQISSADSLSLSHALFLCT